MRQSAHPGVLGALGSGFEGLGSTGADNAGDRNTSRGACEMTGQEMFHSLSQRAYQAVLILKTIVINDQAADPDGRMYYEQCPDFLF